MLLEREDLRDRMIRLVGGAGGGDLNQTTQALNETARRVSRYLLMQLVVNATYGIPIGVGPMCSSPHRGGLDVRFTDCSIDPGLPSWAWLT